STVNRADIVAVLSALVQLIPEKLTNSTIVQLGELGSFRTNIKSTGAPTEEEVGSGNVVGNKVVFTPGRDIKNALQTATYQKV
ncbi:MAG TPA: DNA-binding protein, partial [Flavobacteriaceae bacterium]